MYERYLWETNAIDFQSLFPSLAPVTNAQGAESSLALRYRGKDDGRRYVHRTDETLWVVQRSVHAPTVANTVPVAVSIVKYCEVRSGLQI